MSKKWKYETKPDVCIESKNVRFDPTVDYVELMRQDLAKKKKRGLTNIRLFGDSFTEDENGNVIQNNMTPQRFAYSYCVMFDLIDGESENDT